MGRRLELAALLASFLGFLMGLDIVSGQASGAKLYLVSAIFGVSAYCLTYMVLSIIFER